MLDVEYTFTCDHCGAVAKTNPADGNITPAGWHSFNDPMGSLALHVCPTSFDELFPYARKGPLDAA